MSKQTDLLSRFGANLAESMGAGRASPAADGAPTAAGPSRQDGCTRLRTAVEIEVNRVVPDPSQPRVEFDPDAITRLAESMKTHGQLTPISVRWDEGRGRYLIVTGERRWRAAVASDRRTIAAVIIEGERTDSQILEMQLIENCLREDLKPVEQARAFRTLMDRNDWPALKLADVLHLNCGTITRMLALLDLPAPIQEQVESGALAPTVAYEISKVADPAARVELAERVVSEGLSRTETVAAVKAAQSSARTKGRGVKPKSRKATERVFRTGNGKLTLENRRGVDDAVALAALREATAQVEARLKADEQEAA